MDSLIFAFEAVTPIILMVAIGYLIKRIGFLTADMAKIINKLVFRIFLPSMLFLNVYKIDSLAALEFDYILYAVIAIILIFSLSVLVVMKITPQGDRRGALLQACFRSNYALIGIPLAASLFGQEGVAVATLLSAASIPLFNVLAVVSLSIFGRGNQKPSGKKILSGIAKNPLIQSILLGLLILGLRAVLVENQIAFRLTDIQPIYTVLGYLSNLATPLALLMLGVQFEFSAVKELKREILFGTLIRTVLVPLLGLGIAFLFLRSRFDGAQFAALVALFATPVAVSSVPMAQEMGADHTLAGQLVVWTTLISAVTVFIASFLLRLAGIF
ncbi:MAG: AEC family transporter [Ruminococcaceae bacterium]|nr:AEC family transporter [Oscillospiraceae bacterium]